MQPLNIHFINSCAHSIPKYDKSTLLTSWSAICPFCIIIAIARMIQTAIYHMLETGEVFNSSDLYKFDMPQRMVQQQKDKAIIQAIKLLIDQGIIKTEGISVV